MRKFVIKKEKDLNKFLEHFNTEVFAFDTETCDEEGGHSDRALKYYYLDIEGMSLSDGKIACYIDFVDNPEREELLERLARLMNNVLVLIGHNLAFDLKVLHKININVSESAELYCTMVADHLINENRRHGLKHLAKELLGHEVVDYKQAQDDGSRSKKFYNYAINDAVWTYELAMYQKPILKEEGLLRLFRDIEMPFQRVLLDMEVNGMLVDQEKVVATRHKIKKELSLLLTQMCELLEIPYEIQYDFSEDGMQIYPRTNFNSSQQLAEILFDKLGLPVIETTPSGAPSVGKFTIERLKGKHEFVGMLDKYKKLQKLYNSYFSETAQIPTNLDGDGRVRPNFHDTGTATGRLSCSQPNLQQLPKKSKDVGVDTREAFIVPEGKKMLTCDYSGQELRVLTEISKEPVLIETFNKGKDMHLSTANDFFELGLKEEQLYETYDGLEELKEKYKDERNKSKTINFGMAYGKGAYGFSKDFGISEEEAQGLLDKYFSALPGVKRSIEAAHESVRKTGSVASMTGRRRHFKANPQGFYPGAAFRQAFNFQIQGFSADMIRMAMVAVREVSKKNPQWGLKAIATVHDEAVYEVNEDSVEEASKAVKEAFESVVDFCIPVVAEVGIGENYSTAK